jgi:thiol-disulfide isomerase/thioredoxin
MRFKTRPSAPPATVAAAPPVRAARAGVTLTGVTARAVLTAVTALTVVILAPVCKEDSSRRTPIETDLGKLDESNIGALMKRYRGKVVVMNFWARWCKPCAREMPALVAVVAAHREQGVVLITVDMTGSGSVAQTRAFLDRHGVKPPRFRYAGDRLKAFTETLGVTWGGSLPATFIFGRQGALRWAHLGPVTRQELEDRLKPML